MNHHLFLWIWIWSQIHMDPVHLRPFQLSLPTCIMQNTLHYLPSLSHYHRVAWPVSNKRLLKTARPCLQYSNKAPLPVHTVCIPETNQKNTLRLTDSFTLQPYGMCNGCLWRTVGQRELFMHQPSMFLHSHKKKLQPLKHTNEYE